MNKIEIITSIAKQKLSKSSSQIVLSAIMAGAFCSFGMFAALSAASQLNANPATMGWANIIFSFVFTIALTLISFTDSELFTGDIFSYSTLLFQKQIFLKRTIMLLLLIYFGNYLGAQVISIFAIGSGLVEVEALNTFILNKTIVKLEPSFFNLFIRGILCNILICVAVWANSLIKSEVGKMIIVFWCIFGFCLSGFEHSIANMGFFVMADTPLLLAAQNLIPVSLGNVVGGLLVAFFCWKIYEGKS